MVFLAVPLLELSIEGWGGLRVGGGTHIPKFGRISLSCAMEFDELRTDVKPSEFSCTGAPFLREHVVKFEKHRKNLSDLWNLLVVAESV